MFPNAGVSHDETVAAGAAVLGDTAAAFGKDIIRLLEAAVSALNVIQHSTRTTEHILTSGSKSSVIHALRTLESKKKKRRFLSVFPIQMMMTMRIMTITKRIFLMNTRSRIKMGMRMRLSFRPCRFSPLPCQEIVLLNRFSHLHLYHLLPQHLHCRQDLFSPCRQRRIRSQKN